jgi:hypothetical protein
LEKDNFVNESTKAKEIVIIYIIKVEKKMKKMLNKAKEELKKKCEHKKM